MATTRNFRTARINEDQLDFGGRLNADDWGIRAAPTGPTIHAPPTAGTIAFTGFNADDPDSLAFAALDDLAAGTVITFDDNEWSGTAFNTGEGTITLTLTSAVSAGTIIRIDGSNTATPTTSHGTIARSGSFDLSGTTESVYAYTGTAAAPTFLTALGISGFTGATTTGLLTNTGLTLGTNAIDLGVIDAGADIGAYNGARSGQASFAAYASIINNTANWVTQDAAGSQAGDGTDPDTPFSATPFTLAAPGSLAIDNVTLAEGNAGTTAFSFTVTRSGGSTGAVGATWTLVAPGGAGNADAGDFDGAQLFTGTVAFADGDTSETITILVQGDLIVEGNEAFTVVLSAPTGGATITDATGDGSITNDDVAPVPGTLSIDDVTLAEGDSGTTAFTFTVTRTGGDDGAVGATWTLNAPGGAGNADAGDFDGAQLFTGTVAFADGELSKTITILVQGDNLVETDENFTVTLSAPTGGASLGDASGAGTITNDDAAGSLSIGDRTLAEGDSGTTAFAFTVLRSSGSDGAVGASWTLDAPGGANLADLVDFAPGQPTSGTVSFADGETSQTITILVQGDVTFEDVETFLVTLSAPTGGATLGNANGTGTINNDDPAPAGTLSVDDVSHSEGDIGSTTTFTFTVTRSAGTAGAITADWTISAPGGAGLASTSDFVGGAIFSGQVAFADGETSRTISIDVEGDVMFEADETFTVTLSNATGGAGIGDGTGTGTIVNDDLAPPAGSVSIGDVSIVEGNAGTSILIMTLTRIGGTAAFDVNYATSNGGIPGHASATAGSDYVAASGLVSFAAGQNTATIQITINGDTTPELSEEFTVTLSGATNGATLSDATAVATITTDDPQPASVRIFDEDFTGFTAGGFAPNPTATQIDSDIWRVVGLSDIPNPAYGFTATTGDFARGTIGTNDPTTAGVYSPLSNPALVVQPTGAELEAGGFIEARITNNSGSTATGFDIVFDWVYRNSGDRASTLAFSYSTDGTNFTAVPAAGFVTPATLAVGAVFTTQNEVLSLTGLSVADGGFVYLRWTHVSSAGGGNRDEVGIDNLTVDATGGATGPLVSVSDVSVNEAAGTMTFTVTRANAASGAFTVNYETANGTATAGDDYVATSGTLSFADNQVSATVTVTINDEGIPELDETLFLNLSNATGATIADGQGVGTIVNDDGTPIQVSINDVSIVEGQSGTSTLIFTVTRTGGTGAFDVNFQTQNGSAVEPGDYLANSGTLSFGVGQNSQTISITINGDLDTESNETFQVLLSGATNNAIITDGAGTGTIVNDEPTFIHDIQGTSYFSPILASDGITGFNIASTTVVTVRAIVTAVDNVGPRQGYYLAEEITDWDGNSFTSEGIFVMTRNDAGVGSVVSGVSVGDLIQISAQVMEYQAFSTMPRTVLVNSSVPSVISSGNALPTVTLTNMPNAVMTLVTPDYTDSSDGAGDTFDASVYALSYFETVEGMLVTIPNMVVADGFVSTSGGDPFLQAYSLDSANPGQINSRGGYTISGDPPIGPPDTATPLDDTHNGGQVLHDGDVNPDIIELDFTDFAGPAPTGLLENATMGDLLGDVTGIIDFDFTDRKLFVTAMEPGGFVDAGNPVQEVTLLGDDSRSLTVATFNVENLDPGDGAARFTALANAIANNLNAPDIICIEEMQDNNGATASGGADASTTWQMLVDALNLATGSNYQWVDQEPVAGAEGGEPGGNIRVGFLYNTDRVQLGTLDANATLTERRMYTDRIGDGTRDAGDLIAFSDDMIAAEINAVDWTTTRKSLLGEFVFNGNTVYVTANHWPAKGGSGDFWQLNQNLGAGEPDNSDWAQRNQVAQDVYSILNLINTNNPNAGIVAGGDFNDFYFYRPLTTMTGHTMADGTARVGGARFDNLTLTLPEGERYTYTFDGRSQAIDHIIANGLLSAVATYDVVHLNTGYNSNGTGPNANPALSDHDPGVSSYDYREFSEVLNGTAGNDVIFGFGGNDTINAGAGADLVLGGVGDDTLNGGDNDDILYGQGGTDTTNGGAGDDVHVVDSAADIVVELGGQGNDIVYTQLSYTLTADASVEILSTQTHADTSALNLTGSSADQTIIGNYGDNVINGGLGADVLIGLYGDDIYIVHGAGTSVIEDAGSGNDTVYASVSLTLGAGSAVEVLSTNVHVGTTAINLTGSNTVQTVVGNYGANTLDGKGGGDLLAGLLGADIFAFTSALGASNVDAIYDFEHNIDKIALDDAVFTALSVTLNANAFVLGTAAGDADDRIIYDQATGNLFYDADGSGSASAAVLFATLLGSPVLTASDFQVI